ncbi:MAG: ABC transporter substrate-binding protein [Oscillospiraceae bacterium]|nr:ABC transporter substrate-binding protein [Oscillospiraceae bacterium]
MKKLLAILLVAAMAFTMVACGGAASSAPVTSTSDAASSSAEVGSEPVTIRFCWWGGDSRHEATQKAVDAFMAKYPNITVETEFGAWTDWETNVATQIMAGTAPDLMQINWNWINSYSADGSAFLDLNTVSDILDLSQFPQDSLAKCVVGQNLQSVPVSMTGRIFYWNKTTFDKAGISVPTSLEELMAAGQTFKTKLGDDYYPLVAGEYDRMILMTYYLESIYGKDWVVDGKVNYTVDEIQKGLEWLTSLEEAHVMPTLKKLAGDGAESIDKNQNWIDGHYAGIWEWDSSASKMTKAAEGQEIVVGDFFTDIGEYQGGFTKVSMGFSISANTKHPAETALLMNFLLNEAEGVEIMASERGIPVSAIALKTCKEKGLLNEMVAEANGKVMAYSKYNLDPTYEDAGLKGNPDGVYYKVMSKLSYGEKDAAASAADLLAGVTEVLEK